MRAACASGIGCREDRVVHRRWGRSLTENLGGDTLSDLADRAAVADGERGLRLALHVDEARRDDETGRIDGLLSARAVERVRRRDCDDAVAFDRYVAEEPWVAGSVDDSAILDDEIISRVRRCPIAGRDVGTVAHATPAVSSSVATAFE